MPIYAYRCADCGHTKDVLQKLSDPVLTTCPSCGKETFSKQLTAAGFQLKGSGWYVTDFRGGSNNGAAAKPSGESKSEPAKSDSPASPAASSGSTGSSSGGDSAGGCGTSCACH
jgi:putative FmdB family regulatory protein